MKRLIWGCVLVAGLLPSIVEAKCPGGSILEGLGPVPAEPIYGFGVPSQKWSARNVHYWPYRLTHKSYYEDSVTWGYRTGY